jgi:hypothetical protein
MTKSITTVLPPKFPPGPVDGTYLSQQFSVFMRDILSRMDLRYANNDFGGLGTAGQVLTSNGSSTIPSWGAGGTRTMGATWVNGSGAITTPANDVPVIITAAGTLKEVFIVTQGGTGSCVVDIWKAPFSSYPPTVSNSITGGSPPSIVAGTKYDNSTLTGWTTAFAANDVLMFHLTSSGTFTEISVQLRIA